MQRWLGTILVLVSAAAFGFMAYFKSWAPGLSVPVLLMLRFAIGAAVMAALVVAFRQPWPRGKVLLALLAMGAAGYFGEAYLYFAALDYAPSGMVAMLLYTYPAVVTIVSWLVLKERMTAPKWAALALAVIGSVLTVLPAVRAEGAGSVKPLGVVLGLGCAASYAAYIIVGSRLPKDTGALASAAIVATGAAAMFAIVAGVRAVSVGESLPADPRAWTGVVLLAVVCTVVGVAALLGGLARLGPVRTSTIACFEPVATALVGVLALGESFSPVQIVGGAMIIVGAVISARAGEPNTESPSPQPAPARQ